MPQGKAAWLDLLTILECSQPNCETRKWTVLGEIRVGIFAKQDIRSGTELAYDYNFEWYGGAKVRCLCGAVCCPGFLGAKSRGFQEATHLWEDDDSRYSVDDIPLYDSEDDEQADKYLKAIVPVMDTTASAESSCVPMDVEPLDMLDETAEEGCASLESSHQKLTHKSSAVVSRFPSSSSSNIGRNHGVQPGPPSRASPHRLNAKSKLNGWKQFDVKRFGDCLASEQARVEFLAVKDAKDQAASQLASFYGEIRPAIEVRERDNQDTLPTSLAERWIEPFCSKLKMDFDFHACIVRNIVSGNLRKPGEGSGPDPGDRPPGSGEGVLLLLENGQHLGGAAEQDARSPVRQPPS